MYMSMECTIRFNKDENMQMDGMICLRLYRRSTVLHDDTLNALVSSVLHFIS